MISDTILWTDWLVHLLSADKLCPLFNLYRIIEIVGGKALKDTSNYLEGISQFPICIDLPRYDDKMPLWVESSLEHIPSPSKALLYQLNRSRKDDETSKNANIWNDIPTPFLRIYLVNTTAAWLESRALSISCAHNPTGMDPTHDQWKLIAQIIKVSFICISSFFLLNFNSYIYIIFT